jgi:hypothetical protein
MDQVAEGLPSKLQVLSSTQERDRGREREREKREKGEGGDKAWRKGREGEREKERV